MAKWRCELCQAQRESATKPSKIERLCEDCAVEHWRKVVDIYRLEGGVRLADAKKQLVWAISRLNDYRVKGEASNG